MILQRDNIQTDLSRNELIKYILIFVSIVFLSITAVVVIFPSNTIDLQFTLKIQAYQNAFLDKLMIGISLFGHFQVSVPMVVITALVFLVFKKEKEALFIFFTMGSSIISSAVKYFVNRPRPSKNLVRVIEVTHQQSFPSGHTLFYTVFFGFIIYLMFRLNEANFYLRLIVGLMCAFMVIFVFFSRIYLGAHWLSDVLAGYLLGIICLYAVIYFYELKHYKI